MRNFLIKPPERLKEKLGRYVLYNKKESFVLLLDLKKKLKATYFKNMLYKENLSISVHNTNNNLFMKENVLKETILTNYSIIINGQEIAIYSNYFNDSEVRDIVLRERPRFAGQIFIDNRDVLYIYLKNGMLYEWIKYKEIDTKKKDRFLKERGRKSKEIEGLRPYEGQWRKAYNVLIEEILDEYTDARGIMTDLATEYREELAQIDKDTDFLYKLLDSEFKERYFLTNRDGALETEGIASRNIRKLSDVEIIVLQAVDDLLEYNGAQGLLEGLRENDDCIACFIRDVLGTHQCTEKLKNAIMLQYFMRLKEVLNTKIRSKIEKHMKKQS